MILAILKRDHVLHNELIDMCVQVTVLADPEKVNRWKTRKGAGLVTVNLSNKLDSIVSGIKYKYIQYVIDQEMDKKVRIQKKTGEGAQALSVTEYYSSMSRDFY